VQGCFLDGREGSSSSVHFGSRIVGMKRDAGMLRQWLASPWSLSC
jgi:hypothetical protein